MMKRHLKLIIAALIISGLTVAQQKVGFEPGKGLNFSLNNGAYTFKLSGVIQPVIAYTNSASELPATRFSLNKAYFSLAGNAFNEKIGFYLLTDFSLTSPLLDAWISYQPFNAVTIKIGQMQNISNNREMLFTEDKLIFTDRSILSTSFCETGREFGVQASGLWNIGSSVIRPQISLTSGDGRNSFGIDSRDVDLGGFKYGGRIDFMPLGNFSFENDQSFADLAHEQKLKLQLGIAGNINTGASENVGEGHGVWQLYDANSANKYPEYRRINADILIKYRGLSFMAEYLNATAAKLDGSFTIPNAGSLLQPTEISQYLVLGSGINTQIGYVTKKGIGFDVRYAEMMPEFNENTNSLLQVLKSADFGVTKFFKGNDLKIHASLGVTLDHNNEYRLKSIISAQIVL